MDAASLIAWRHHRHDALSFRRSRRDLGCTGRGNALDLPSQTRRVAAGRAAAGQWRMRKSGVKTHKKTVRLRKQRTVLFSKIPCAFATPDENNYFAFGGLGGSSFPVSAYCGVTVSKLGGTSAFTFPKAHDKPPRKMLWKTGLVQTSSRWPIDV